MGDQHRGVGTASPNDHQFGGDHYRADIQHWDMIEDNGIGYLEGCATKYLTRWRDKDGVKDLQKAGHYVDKLIEKANAKGRLPRGRVEQEDIAAYILANNIGGAEAECIDLLVSNWTITDLSHVRSQIAGLIREETSHG